MTWLIPLAIFIGAVFLWRWSFKTNDRTVAIIRWVLAALVLIVDLIYSAGMLTQWALS